jgi:AbrB family looped-hinge helix DNA binding protein
MVTETVTLSSKGQLVIPMAVRKRAQLVAGAVFAVRYEDGEIHLRPLAPIKMTTLADVAGCLAKPGRSRLSKAQVDTAIKARLKARNTP